jgi:hypothetical protein
VNHLVERSGLSFSSRPVASLMVEGKLAEDFLKIIRHSRLLSRT